MIEKIALRTFWTCMILCATTVLTLLWFPPMSDNMPHAPLRFQIAGSFFIIGLASLLVWVPLITYQFYKRLEDR